MSTSEPERHEFDRPIPFYAFVPVIEDVPNPLPYRPLIPTKTRAGQNDDHRFSKTTDRPARSVGSYQHGSLVPDRSRVGRRLRPVVVKNLSAVDTCTECEGMGYALAELFTPVIGAVWGLVAGGIGAGVGVSTRSRRIYSWAMASLASLPLALSVLVSFVGTERFIHTLVLTLAAGGIVWGIGWSMSRPLDVSLSK